MDPAAPHLIDATMFWNRSGGVRRYIEAKRGWLHAHTDWRHTVATPRPEGDGAFSVPSLPLPGSDGSYRWAWRRSATAQALCAAAPDLIEAADPYRLAWSALDAARALGIPAVAFCHSNLERMAALAAGRWHLGAERAARRYAAHLYERFDLVLAPSAAMLAHLNDWGVSNAEHQPLGVDTRVFNPQRRHPAWRRSIGLPDDARILVYAGRFAPEKHLATLAAATGRLGAGHWLVAIGAGPAPPAGERVRVLPPIAHAITLSTALASADVYVHAGDQETFGLSALEALACGLPVVARATEGLAELIDDRVGHGVHADTPQAFADAVAEILAREPRTLRDAARARALQHDWEQVVPRLYQRYRRLMRAHARR
ncbi:MAG TPA: glycosyltransferase [Burkholderiaceae bacterium]|jgi:alpha-1,6-mannosyltransferase